MLHDNYIQPTSNIHKRFSFAISLDGFLFASGKNKHGCLGLGDCRMKFCFTKVKGFGNSKIVDIDTAGNSVISLTEEGL